MPNYTIVNLREVEDAAKKYGMPPGLESRFAREPLKLSKQGLSLFTLAPGYRLPFGHRHGEQEEVYVVVEGGGRVKLDDDVAEIRRFDAIRVAPGVARAFEAGPDGLAVIAIGAHALAPDDRGDVLPDWWTDHET